MYASLTETVPCVLRWAHGGVPDLEALMFTLEVWKYISMSSHWAESKCLKHSFFFASSYHMRAIGQDTKIMLWWEELNGEYSFTEWAEGLKVRKRSNALGVPPSWSEIWVGTSASNVVMYIDARSNFDLKVRIEKVEGNRIESTLGGSSSSDSIRKERWGLEEKIWCSK